MTVPSTTNAVTNQAAQPDSKIYISRFPNLIECRGNVVSYEGWHILLKALKESKEDPDGVLAAWSPCTFERNLRSPSQVETVSAIVLRYSGEDTKPREAFDFWTDEAFKTSTSCLVYTEDSDLPTMAPFYVVIPLRRAETRAEFEEVAKAVLSIARARGHELKTSVHDLICALPWPSLRTRCLGPREGAPLLDPASLRSGTSVRASEGKGIPTTTATSFSIEKYLGEVRSSSKDVDKVLNRAAFVAALQIAKGCLDEATAARELIKAGLDAGLGAAKAEQVVERAIRDGKVKAAEQGTADRWDDPRLKKGTNGRIDGTQVSNIILVLREHPSWKHVVRYSEFDHRVHLLNPPFRGTFYAGPVNDQKWVEDNDLTCVRSWLETTLDMSVSKENLIDALVAVGMSQSFHPVREWLDSLVWDGTPRIEHWLKDYCGAEVETESQRIAVPAMSKRWLISAVARANEPGAKVDCTLVLEGAQSIKKSTTFATLVPNEAWFSDERLNLDSKDTLQQIQGKWIIEIAELASFRGKANEEIKHFLTKRADDFRKPYEKINRSYPRQCVFGGTVNDAEYLSDPTGNRRFFPVRCHGLDSLGGKIDIVGLRAVRDQLWAEAVHEYKRGEQWWLTEEEEDAARVEQESRFTEDAWQSRVEAWIEAEENGSPRDAFSMDEVLLKAVCIDPGRQGRAEQTRMKNILNRLGFERKQVTIDGKRPWRYCRRR
jgi:predicted P-loop ATPase